MHRGWKVLALGIAWNLPLWAQDSVRVEYSPVVVTATRAEAPAISSSQSVQVLDSLTVRDYRGGSMDDLLRKNTSLDIQGRGASGVQTDIGMRGGLYSQTLVLVDGIRVNDPQTGHHTMDLPVVPAQLDHVEIMQGPGSSLYGADAYGGTINFLTREPQANRVALRLGSGSFGYAHAAGAIDAVATDLTSSIAVDYSHSSGYRYDTDFTVWNASAREGVSIGGQQFTALLGYASREFGAYDFYSPGLGKPSKEWTSAVFASLKTSLHVASLRVEPAVYYRRHNDKFMFDLRTPDMFVNIHHTNTYGGHVVASMEPAGWLGVNGGWDYDGDGIASTKLGEHHRAAHGVFVVLHSRFAGMAMADAGMRFDHNSMYGSFWSPSAGISIMPLAWWKLFLHAGRSFRAPSYTELYYADPANVGNPGLTPETGWSVESGTQAWFGRTMGWSIVWFHRAQDNLIDYAQYFAGDRYHAVNLSSAKTSGLECSVETMGWSGGTEAVRLASAGIDYTYLVSSIDRKDAYTTRYAFLHPRHQLLARMEVGLPAGFRIGTACTYRHVDADRHWAVVNLQARRAFAWGDVTLSADNLLDTAYEEIPGLPRPGRWLMAGIQVTL